MCLAVPGRVLDINARDPLLPSARVDFGGVVKNISLAYTPQARPGDYVLAHVGFAMTVIDEAEAARTLQALREVAAAVEGDQPPEPGPLR
jgi:hydrogenase expression/formation protein HypC